MNAWWQFGDHCATATGSTRQLSNMDTAQQRTHPVPIQTIRAAYTEIGRRVNIALRTQVGDAARLREQRQECLRLLTLVGQVSHSCPCYSASDSIVNSMYICSLHLNIRLLRIVSIR
jgi:hypothetical protein